MSAISEWIILQCIYCSIVQKGRILSSLSTLGSRMNVSVIENFTRST